MRVSLNLILRDQGEAFRIDTKFTGDGSLYIHVNVLSTILEIIVNVFIFFIFISLRADREAQNAANSSNF